MEIDPQYVPFIIGGGIAGLVLGIIVILCIFFIYCGGFKNCCKKEQIVNDVPNTKFTKYAAPKRPSLVKMEMPDPLELVGF